MTSPFFAHQRRTPEEAYRIFFEALQHYSLRELVRTASDFFGVPVLLTNEHYHLITMYPKEKIGVSLYDTLLARRILPKELIVSYQQEYLTGTEHFYDPFYADTGQVEECPRIFGEVHSGSRIYGHFAIMLSDEPLYDTDLACAAIFRDALSILMMRPKLGDYSTYGTYMQNLLDADTAPDQRIFAQEEISRIMTSGYALMVTRIGTSASQHAFAAMSTSSLSRNYYEVITTICGDYLVSLFGSVRGTDTYRPSEAAFYQKTAETLSRAGRSGLSRPFQDLLDLPVHFKEAMLALNAGTETLSIFYDVMPTALFQDILDLEDARVFLHPALEQIRKYDSENLTHYYETLRVYSLCLHNKEQAAAELCIHRNTLLYRTNRIAELFDLQLEDTTTALYLINSFQILEAMERDKMRE